MTLKEQIAKARKVEDIRHELDTYQNAIKGGSKFEEYYQSKIVELLKKLNAI